MRVTKFALGVVFSLLILFAALATPKVARADMNTTIMQVGSENFNLEDLSLFYVRNLGSNGLFDFIQQVIIYKEAKQLGIGPSDKEINDFIKDYMKDDIYNDYKNVFTERSIRQLISFTLASENYDKYIRNKLAKDLNIKISESEAKKFYIDNIDKIHRPETREISVISTDKAKAEKAIAELKKGAKFPDVAAKYCEDPEMRESKGYLGLIDSKVKLESKEIFDNIFKTDKGKYSDIIKGPKFYNIIFVHQIAPKYEPRFEDIKDKLIKDLTEVKLQKPLNDAYSELIQKHIKDIDIKVELFKAKDISKVDANKATITNPKKSPEKPSAPSK